MKLDGKKLGLTLGIFFAIMHTAGVVLLLITRGWLLSWVLAAHFVSASISLMPFNGFALIGGILTAFVVGCAVGAVFALVWNVVMKK